MKCPDRGVVSNSGPFHVMVARNGPDLITSTSCGVANLVEPLSRVIVFSLCARKGDIAVNEHARKLAESHADRLEILNEPGANVMVLIPNFPSNPRPEVDVTENHESEHRVSKVLWTVSLLSQHAQ
jgi:hypothetical protein